MNQDQMIKTWDLAISNHLWVDPVEVVSLMKIQE